MIRDYPLIKFVILFSAGILIQFTFQIPVTALLALYIITAILLIIIIVKNNPDKTIDSSIVNPGSWILILLIIITGALCFDLENMGRAEYPFKKGKLSGVRVYGEVKEIELLRNDYFNFIVRSDSVLTGEYSVKQTVVYLCKLKRNGSSINPLFDTLEIGNQVIIEGVIRKGREKRNPFEFDYNAYLNSSGIDALLYIKKISDVQVTDNASAHFANSIYRLRSAINSRISRLYNAEAAGLVKGLLLADKSGIDYGTREQFVNSGVIHVLAVSGLHVGFIAYIFFILFNRFNIYLRYIATIAGLFFFVLLTGSPASVFRASLMASILLVTQMSNRSYNNFNTMAFAALILLLINPNELLNPGFQLSFSAVFSILFFYPIFRDYIYMFERLPVIVGKLLLFFAVSLSAQLGTLPFTLTYFHKLSVIALLSNLLVIPLIGFILSTAIASLIFSVISMWLGEVISKTNEVSIDLLYRFVKFTGSLDFSFFYIPAFSIYDGLLFYFCLFGFVYGLKNLSSPKLKVIYISLLALIFLVYYGKEDKLLRKGFFSIIVIDIGQGDSIFLRFPNGKNALIDGGDSTPGFDNGMRVIYPLLRNLGVENIDYGIVSHMDADHYKGMVSIIEAGMIDTLFKPVTDPENHRDIEFESMMDSLGIPVFYHSESSFNIGSVRIYSLTDTSSLDYKSFDINNKSGIYKIIYGSTSFLFAGDAEKSAEFLLAGSYGSFLKSDVLKVGHHGSKTSTTEKFLDFVDPDIALISAGQFNKFKHPSKSTIDKLKRKKIRILRTDLSGAVILQSNGKEISIVDWR